MIDSGNTAPAVRRRAAWPAGLLVALAALAGCDSGPKTGEVTGTVTVDDQVPPDGSSITFIPTDGKSPSAGATLDKGKYTARVSVGPAKVEIRAPRSIKAAKARTEGPGPGGPANIEESLPARYNDKTELTFDVQSGRNEKNWDLKTK